MLRMRNAMQSRDAVVRHAGSGTDGRTTAFRAAALALTLGVFPGTPVWAVAFSTGQWVPVEVTPQSGSFFVNLGNSGAPNSNNNNCGNFGGYYALAVSTPMTDLQKAIWTTIQGTYFSRTKIQIWSVGCSGGGTSGYPTIDTVWAFP